MKVYFPAYFEKFHCIASACPDSCCKEWEIDIDESTAAFYRSLSGPLGDDIQTYLRDTEDGTVMTIKDGRCPMWQQDGLCRIQKELGHEALSHVCREFPRLTHDYGNFQERGLELSCPEAARLILTEDDRLLCREFPGEGEAEYDEFAMDILQKSRRVLLEFLSTTSLPVPDALSVMLLYGYEVQNWLDGGQEAVLELEALLTDARRFAGTPDVQALRDFFKGLEILTIQWQQLLDCPPAPPRWEPAHLALARYGVLRYWYQAVSDYDLVCRVKLILASCLLVGSLGGEITETAQLFSKEIENDPDNVDAILDGAYTHPALTDANLLGLLKNF